MFFNLPSAYPLPNSSGTNHPKYFSQQKCLPMSKKDTSDWDLNKWLAWKKKREVDPPPQEPENPEQSQKSPEANNSDITEPVNGNPSSIWSFWPNRSTSSIDASVKADISFLPNTLYTENINLNEEIPTDKNRSTSLRDSKNVIVPSFEESHPQYSYINGMLQKVGISLSEPVCSRNTRPNTNFKKVLIIGVHGFFPTKYIRPLIGEPTGTSRKFMLEAENSFRIWLQENQSQFRSNQITISKIALEQEGKVFDRVAYFLQVLSAYDLNQYDMIYIAAHSQGTPVSIILLALLIQQGYIKDADRKLIGVLAMAGISNGPFYGINQRMFVKAYSKMESDSMLELFEFQDFESVHSKKYLHSLKILVANNVRIAFVGSIDDQLVPLYSSICSHVYHPNITRYIYIDKDSNTPNFLVRILNCSLLLQNLGFKDHGMIREISNALAGPLTGGGHSKIYNEFKVYELGIKNLLYSNLEHSNMPLRYKSFKINKLGENPFHLPWCLRGLMYESLERLKNGKSDVVLMLKDFDEWNPNTKVLKEIKYRLSAMKAKL